MLTKNWTACSPGTRQRTVLTVMAVALVALMTSIPPALSQRAKTKASAGRLGMQFDPTVKPLPSLSGEISVPNTRQHPSQGIERLHCTGFQQETGLLQGYVVSSQLYPKSYYAALPLSRKWVVFDGVQFIFNDGKDIHQNIRIWKLPANRDINKQISPFSQISVSFQTLEIQILASPQYNNPGFHGGFSCVVTGVGAKPATQWRQWDVAR